MNDEHDRSQMKFVEDIAVGCAAAMRPFASAAEAETALHRKLGRRGTT